MCGKRCFFCHSDDAVAISTATEWIKEQEVAKDNKIKHTAQGERVRKKRFFYFNGVNAK